MADRPEPPHLPDGAADEAPVIGGSAGEVLGLCDDFFRGHASAAVHAELREFLTGLGYHPVAGLGAFLTELSSLALRSETGRPRHEQLVRAAELTRSLAGAVRLPEGARLRDVGAYRALEVMARAPGEYWATADVIDEEGSGHLEVTVARATRWMPPTLAELLTHPGETGAERLEPDGSVVTTCTTTTSGGTIAERAILARPDGTYVDVRASNEDALTTGPTRPSPPMAAEAVLTRIADLRP